MAQSAAKNSKMPSFSDEERAAMRERAKELQAEAKASKNRDAGEKAVLEAITAMNQSDQDIANKLHSLVSKTAPDLMPKTWYGMPAYANADGKVILFFQGASKFNSRYATIGFNDTAKLDTGNLWPTTFAITSWNKEAEAFFAKLLLQAIA